MIFPLFLKFKKCNIHFSEVLEEIGWLISTVYIEPRATFYEPLHAQSYSVNEIVIRMHCFCNNL